MNIIHTTGLTKTYGTNGVAVHALRGIDLEVARGEFVALATFLSQQGIAESGGGKVSHGSGGIVPLPAE